MADVRRPAAALAPGRRPVALGEAFPAVLGAAQANAPWAFERLFHAYAGPVAGYVRSQGVPDPDGVANEVFFAAFRRLGDFAGSEPRFRSWLFTIAHNRVVDERRRAARRPRLTEEAARDPVGGDVEAEALARLGEERVRALLSALPADQRSVLLLRIAADLTVQEVADVLGKRPGAVKALQRRFTPCPPNNQWADELWVRFKGEWHLTN
jgi:RNA polymerase sigma factor (sigma-70 family)